MLSVWRITHLLQAEDGPWDLIVHLRRKAGMGFWGQLLDCFYCLSVWIAAPFALYLGKRFSMIILMWPALSAGAILLERLTDRGYGGYDQTPVLFVEESEEENGLLRQEKGAGVSA